MSMESTIMTYLEEQIAETTAFGDRKLAVLRQCRKHKKKDERRRALWQRLGLDTTLIFGGGRRVYLDDGGRARDNIKRLFDEGTKSAVEEARRLQRVYGLDGRR